ncbi:MAG: methyltransferase domain-containing protein [Methylomonas sp.]|nr:methyltransferase domain-containing protein [Methylomonas sp.]
MTALQAKWDAIYSNDEWLAEASETLLSHRHLLPKKGRALDLACGLGGNAMLLAAHGLSVDAWDISAVALAKLQQHANHSLLPIVTRQCSITPETLAIAGYDVIIVSRFLDRSLCNAIMGALKPEGLLFYQTFTRNKLDQQGPCNPDYLLERNELLALFAPLSLIYYREYAHIGDLRYGNRNEACYIGQKNLTGMNQ